MEFKRYHRVAEQIHKDISALLLQGVKDPRIGFVTITGVEVTPDLSLAKVFYTVMGDEQAKKQTQKGLQSAMGHIRRTIGANLKLRRVPELRFEYDSSLEYGNRMEDLFREIHEKEGEGDDSENPDHHRE